MPPKTNEEYMREIRNIQPAHPLVYERIEQILTEKDQELQQARKQAVRQFAEDLCRVCTKRWPEYGQALPLYSEDVVAIASRYLDQSELDQPIS